MLLCSQKLLYSHRLVTVRIGEGGNAIASVRPSVMGQANSIGPTSIEGSFFLVDLELLHVSRS